MPLDAQWHNTSSFVLTDSQISEYLSQNKSDEIRRPIFLFDQVLAGNLMKWVSLMVPAIKDGTSVIIVSSEGVVLKDGTFQESTCINHRFPGWTMEEYEACCEDQAFFDSVKDKAFGSGAEFMLREELLADKFYYAGHSARLMFRKTKAQAIDSIRDNTTSFQPTIGNLTRALKAPKAQGAVHFLMSWLHECNGPTPVEESSPVVGMGAFAACG